MTKRDLKENVYLLLKELEDDGVLVRPRSSEDITQTPLVTYSILNVNPLVVQGRVKRWATYSFNITIYANNPEQAMIISDKIDDLLMPVGFTETQIVDDYDSRVKKFVIDSVYSIDLDEDGISYNLK